jgi:hypothetical protein
MSNYWRLSYFLLPKHDFSKLFFRELLELLLETLLTIQKSKLLQREGPTNRQPDFYPVAHCNDTTNLSHGKHAHT